MIDAKKLDFNSVISTKLITNYGKTRDIYYFTDKDSLEYKCAVSFNTALKKLDVYSHLNTTQITENIIHNLQSLGSAKQFTIVKFDFVNYFGSLSTSYIYDYYLHGKLDAEIDSIAKAYAKQVPYVYAGLAPSNILASIMTHIFQNALLDNLQQYKVLGLYSYVDDFVLILGENVSKDNIIAHINTTITQVFGKPHKVPNDVHIYTDGPKFSYLTQDNLPLTFVNLGYAFNLFDDHGIKFTIGIPQYKRDAYHKIMQDVIKNNYGNVERLRSYIYCYTHRIVSKVKGSNGVGKNVSYTRLASSHIVHTYYPLFDDSTIKFFQNAIFDCFDTLQLRLPYYLADRSTHSAYNLHHNIIAHKAIVLNPKFGLPYANLKALVQPLSDKPLDNYSYDKLAHIILTKIVKI